MGFASESRMRLLLVPLGAVVLIQCGGATRSQGNEDGGTPMATGTGTGTGTTGSGGSSGGDICQLPMVSGPCDAAIPAWWHDPETGVCVPFTYGGCQGNSNNFSSLEACQMTCSGGAPDMDACSGPGECVLLGPACCLPCDPVASRSFVAVNRASAPAYTRVHGCGAVDCIACPVLPEPDSRQQYFIATCDMGHCRVTDVRETGAAACATPEDCMLRDGAECCEGCDGHGIVSVNRSGGLEKLVCPMPFTSCPPCAPIIPDGYVPTCNAGRCAVGAILR